MEAYLVCFRVVYSVFQKHIQLGAQNDPLKFQDSGSSSLLSSKYKQKLQLMQYYMTLAMRSII